MAAGGATSEATTGATTARVRGAAPFSGHRSSPPDGLKPGRALTQVAERNGKTVRQVVLNFLTRDGVFAIPKSGNPAHVRENAGGQGWRLTDQDIAEIDRAFPAPDRDTPLGMI